MEPSISCIIVDDEALARAGVEENIDKIPDLSLQGSFSSVKKAIAFLNSNTCDLIFLDIQMPEINGLEFKQLLNHEHQDVMVVFITAYRDYALEGFDLNAVDYLLKPLSFDRFSQMFQKVKKIKQTNTSEPSTEPSDSFFIKVDGKIIKIKLNELCFVQSLKDYVFIFTNEHKYLTLLSIKSIEEKLASQQFLRVHRSYIVNKEKIDSISGNELQLKACGVNHNIPISKNKKEEILSNLIGDKLWKRE